MTAPLRHVRTFVRDRFRLALWDTGRKVGEKTELRFEFYDQTLPMMQRLVFARDDFRVPPQHALDSDATVWALLGFLALGEGDVDPEFFDDYTPAQLEWRDSPRREELAAIAMEIYEVDREEPDAAA